MSESQQHESVERKRALIVDDEPLWRSIIQRLLGPLNLSFELASDAQEARSLLGKNSFDLILCDFQLPGQEGLELTLELENDPSLAPKVVLVTAHGKVATYVARQLPIVDKCDLKELLPLATGILSGKPSVGPGQKS
ncbi:MAG: response regulator [Acidobacteriota bacterium]